MKLLKWLGIGAGLVLVAGGIAFGTVVFKSNARMLQAFDVQPDAIEVPDYAVAATEGERLFVSRGCVDCHGTNLGGKTFIDDPAAGTIGGANLTAGEGGSGATYTPVDYVRAIRHGIAQDGRPLVFMPSHEYNPINDEQLGQIIAYIQGAEPVDNQPPLQVGPLMRVLFLAGEVPLLPAELIDHDAAREPAVPVSDTVEYGAYIAASCVGCHGDGYSGGKIPGTPPDFPAATNLTPGESGISDWTESDFFTAMREGKRPDGSTLDEFMPWKNFGKMTDVELKATWKFLQTLPPKAEGNR